MIENNKSSLFVLGLTLSLGLIISVLILSGTLKQIKYSDHFVTVKGYAEKKIVSDLGTWSGMFSVESKDMNTAFSQLESTKEIIKQFLLKSGVNENSISWSPVTSLKVYKKDEKGNVLNQIEAYSLSRHVNIASKDVYLINRISNEISALLQQGIYIDSNPPQFFYTSLEGLKKEMIEAATKEAKERAELLAKSTGSKVAGLKQAEQGVFQITALNSTDVSDYGTYDLQTIEKMIKAVVTADFLIK